MWSLFKDKNEINEKNVVGFASFVVMCLFAIGTRGTLPRYRFDQLTQLN